MNAFDQLNQEKENRFIEIRESVGKLLHPLVSQYDLSESNYYNNMNNNPCFRRAVDHLAHLIINMENQIPDYRAKIERRESVMGDAILRMGLFNNETPHQKI